MGLTEPLIEEFSSTVGSLAPCLRISSPVPVFSRPILTSEGFVLDTSTVPSNTPSIWSISETVLELSKFTETTVDS